MLQILSLLAGGFNPSEKYWAIVMIIPNTLWLFNIAMENYPFIDNVAIKTTIYRGFSMAMLNNQMVYGKIKNVPTHQSD